MWEVAYEPGWQTALSWTVYAGFVVSFLMLCGMGATDCSNSFGTLVGADTLKLWQIYVIATVFETLGAALLGYRVTETIREGIVSPSIYSVFVQQNETTHLWYQTENCTAAINASSTDFLANKNCKELTSAQFYFGELGAICGTAIWLTTAAMFSLPVSVTQSIIGATVGFTVVFHGFQGIKYEGLIHIAISWISSPLLAGLFSVVFFEIVKFTVFKRADPLQASVNTAPVWFWFALTINSFSVFFGGSKYLQFDKFKWWQAALISNGVGLVVAVLIWLFGRAPMRRAATRVHYRANRPDDSSAEGWKDKILKISSSKQVLELNLDFPKDADSNDLVKSASSPPTNSSMSSSNAAESQTSKLRERSLGSKSLLQSMKALIEPCEEEPRAVQVFSFLQIMSCCFLAFSHGSNDPANSVGPVFALLVSYQYGLATHNMDNDPEIIYIILFGAFTMLIGLYLMGHRVMKTIGKDLTVVTAPSGFCITLGTAFTVLFSSKLGIPVATTPCMVGAVVFVGVARSNPDGVSWRVFRNVVFGWLVTPVIAAACSAASAWLLAHFALGHL